MRDSGRRSRARNTRRYRSGTAYSKDLVGSGYGFPWFSLFQQGHCAEQPHSFGWDPQQLILQA